MPHSHWLVTLASLPAPETRAEQRLAPDVVTVAGVGPYLLASQWLLLGLVLR